MGRRIDPEPRRVLVYRLGSLGDMLIAVPSLRLIRRAYPKAEIRLLSNRPVSRKAPAAAAVLDGTGLVNGYFDYPVGTRSLREVLRLWWGLRRWKPDVVIYLAAARGLRTALRDQRFFRLCGVRRSLGVPVTRAMQANCYGADPDSEQGVRLLSEKQIEPEAARLARNLAELGEAGLQEQANWRLDVSAREQQAARDAIGPELLRRPLLAVSVGTKVQAKDWGRDNWRALLVALAVRLPEYGLLLIGAPEEAEASHFAAQGWRQAGGGPLANLCGYLSPRESAAALGHARLFVGHDSGPLHLAASVGTPSVALFAARNLPRQWFPFGEQHRVLYHPVNCMGCGLETCIEQRKKCLLSISVDEVLHEVESVLGSLEPRVACSSGDQGFQTDPPI